MPAPGLPSPTLARRIDIASHKKAINAAYAAGALAAGVTAMKAYAVADDFGDPTSIAFFAGSDHPGGDYETLVVERWLVGSLGMSPAQVTATIVTLRINAGLIAQGNAGSLLGGLSKVATSGAYADLAGLPAIPSIVGLASLASPTLTGVPTAPTAAVATADGTIASMLAMRNVLTFRTPEMMGYVPAAAGQPSVDAQPYIQAALDTGLTVELGFGSYYVKTPLTMRTNSQILRGQGRANSGIFANGDFPTNSSSPLGVIILASTAGFYELRDFSISFGQGGNYQTINDVVKYPPAIYVRDTQFKIESLQIAAAYLGIDMRGNCGQSTINNLDMGVYYKGILIDGCADSVRINNVHAWVFGIDPSNYTVYNANSLAFEIGRCDDLKITNSLTLCWRGFHFYISAPQTSPYNNVGGGGATGCLANHDFDGGVLGILFEGGDINVESGYTACSMLLNQMGGSIGFNGMTLGVGSNQYIVMNATSAQCRVTNCFILLGSNFLAFLFAAGVAIVNNNLITFGGQTQTQPFIETENARLVFQGNMIGDGGQSPAPVLIDVVNDGFHAICNNVAPGWSIPKPTGSGVGGAVVGIYGPNALQPSGPTA